MSRKLPLVIVWTLSSALAFAQGTGSLRGIVTDQSGAIIPAAQVRISGDGGFTREATSGADGSYSLNGLAPGKYNVRATSAGLTQPESIPVNINPGAATTLNIGLRVVLEKQQINVDDQLTGDVDTDPNGGAGTVSVTGNDLDALSDDPDDLQADLQALAGPSAGPGGAQFYIDGFTAGDAVLPAKSSIREIRINQNPFSPEFETIGYGRTEIFTKPGSDKFRGQVYFNYGDDIFNSRNPFASQKAPFSLKDLGGSFGGALSKRASYFVDLSRRQTNNGSVINAVIVDPKSFVITPFSAVASTPSNRIRVSPRLDYQINPNNTFMFRYGLTDSSNDANGIGGFNLVSRAYAQTMREHAFQATETAVLNSHMIDETHFQFLHQNQVQQSPDLNPSVSVASSFNGGGPGNPDYYYIHHHWEIQNFVSIASGKHVIKAGVRLRAVDVQDSTKQNFNGAWTFGGTSALTSIQQYQQTLRGVPGAGPTQLTLNTGNPLVRIGQIDLSFFAGDDYRIKPNMTLSYGMRYEWQTNVNDGLNFAPRIALAWAPGKPKGRARPKTVIRIGGGLFYDRFNEQNLITAQRFDGVSQQQFIVRNPFSVLTPGTYSYPSLPSVAELKKIPGAQSLQAVRTISPDLSIAYVIQSAIGVERSLPKNSTIAVTWTTSHALHGLRTRNINAPLNYAKDPLHPVYPYAALGQTGPILEMESSGLFNQNQLVTNVNTRVNSKISLFGFYTLSYAKSDADGVNSFPANQYDTSAEYGPSNNDVRHRGSLGGSVATWWNLRLSPLVEMRSGGPFNITTSTDIYGSTILNARPGIVTDPNFPGVVKTAYGLFNPNPLPGDTTVPRNFGRSPGQFSVDLRLARTFSLRKNREMTRAAGSTDAAAGPTVAAPVAGPARSRNGIGGFDGQSTGIGAAGGSKDYNLTVSVSSRNLFNHVNPGPVIGNINSPKFGQSNELQGGNGASSNRRFEFQLRLAF